jgi:hypothetical protein
VRLKADVFELGRSRYARADERWPLRSSDVALVESD